MLQTRIGFCKLPGHGVEFTGQSLQFVPGFYLDSLIEIALRDARCTCLDSLDGLHHTSRHEQSHQGREHQAKKQQQAVALQGGQHRRVGLAQGLFGENNPFQLGNQGIRGEHFSAFEVARNRYPSGVAGAGCIAGRLHLRYFCQVGFLQHAAYIRVRDQQAA